MISSNTFLLRYLNSVGLLICLSCCNPTTMIVLWATCLLSTIRVWELLMKTPDSNRVHIEYFFCRNDQHSESTTYTKWRPWKKPQAPLKHSYGKSRNSEVILNTIGQISTSKMLAHFWLAEVLVLPFLDMPGQFWAGFRGITGTVLFWSSSWDTVEAGWDLGHALLFVPAVKGVVLEWPLLWKKPSLLDIRSKCKMDDILDFH